VFVHTRRWAVVVFAIVAFCPCWLHAFMPDWEQVVDNGFGDTKNTGSYAMAVFDGMLYAGTNNSDDGAEVWRSSDGSAWSPVWVMPGDNYQITELLVYSGELWAGTYNGVSGCEVWRSVDGTTWEVSSSSGFGNSENYSVNSLKEFNGLIYAATSNTDSGSELWRVSPAPGALWQEVDPFDVGDDYAVALGNFNGEFFAITSTSSAGPGPSVWKSANGWIWNLVTPSGIFGAENRHAYFIEPFAGSLVAGTLNTTTGCELWISQDGSDWRTEVTGGFGNSANFAISGVATTGRELLVGLGKSIATTNGDGLEVWASDADGYWVQIEANGFDDDLNRAVSSMAFFRNMLYVSSQRRSNSDGLEIWRWINPIFDDSFETGDTSQWSDVLP